ncbi:uncharacterized protein Z518_09122 [Rhinocladiella mackenziei CBS 650.93]|uniref:Rhinocladiella mackenziei CBS 650.93 unplaced genomic scaffold supercont1.7, whole genome shotgun sequence n=1 Tax=Rhinocladiella mackenziei CBS 650.93 TaxID=1442369 RepID=A0A0D2IDS1_9EURO|nr:uncharacterized protein Z518_09122 [Rhinocladiella mackenziei CBS 650.93]KIX01396.1 hypothetical protein Z518_09122 [Rhinocladiella mackenziei CBS 650.93]
MDNQNQTTPCPTSDKVDWDDDYYDYYYDDTKDLIRASKFKRDNDDNEEPESSHYGFMTYIEAHSNDDEENGDGTRIHLLRRER